MSLFGYEDMLHAKIGETPELVAVLVRAADLMQSEEDCLLYVVGQSEDDPRAVRIFQVWRTTQAHDESVTNPEVRGFISRALPLLDEKPSGTTIVIKGGRGRAF